MGGVAALNRILPIFPPWSPGVVIVQHMPADFTAQFAERLNEVCAMRVTEARHGDRVLPGHILVAPGGDRHLEIRRIGGEYRVHLQPGPPVSGHTPSVDVFFNSLARSAGPRAAACLLTGMGRDGAEGLLALRLAGGRTFAQDQATAAVWGMPRAAVEVGAAEHCVALEQVPQTLVRAARPSVPPRASSLPPRASASTPPRASTSTPPRASASTPPRASASTPAPRASASTPPRAGT
jgi:two-component system chemotaxis response regulator CheB